MEKVDLLLINPSNKKQMYGDIDSGLLGIEPPLWTALIAAFIRDHGFSVQVIDADAEGIGPEETADIVSGYQAALVAVGAMGANPSASSTPKMAAVSKLFKILSERNLKMTTALYGIHPSGLPERTLREETVDYVFRGEVFYSLLHLLQALRDKKDVSQCGIKGLWFVKDGKVIDGGWGPLVEDLDTLPFIAWDLLPMDKYRAHNWHGFGDFTLRSPYAVIYTSLGCPFNCSYCNIHAMYSGRPGIRFRSITKVVDEIELLVSKYKIRSLKILDELFVLDHKRVMEFCDLLIERAIRVNIWAYARVDTVNETVLKRMKKAGVNWLCYGIESSSKEVRGGVSKGRFSEEMVLEAMRKTKEAGIYIIGNFLFGLPDDGLDTMQRTLSLARRINCEYVNFYTTMAYPGSLLYEEALSKGLDLPDSWDGYSQFNYKTKPLPTKYLNSAQVLRFRDDAFNAYFSDLGYLGMIKDKFGQKTVDHITSMLERKLARKLLEV